MVDELRGLGIELMVTTWPFMGMPYDNGTATDSECEIYGGSHDTFVFEDPTTFLNNGTTYYRCVEEA